MLYYVILLYYNFCTLSHFYQVYQNLFDMCPKISKVCNVMNTSIPVEFFPTSKGVLPSPAKLVASALRSNKNCTI